MEGGNGWVSKGLSSGSQDKTIIDRIMLRFRPIAPKPVADGSVSSSAAGMNNNELVGKARKKRKYVRVKKTRRCKVEGEERREVEEEAENIVTLELMPELSGFKGFTGSGSSINLDFKVERGPVWNKFDKSENNGVFGGGGVSDQADRRGMRVVESWVMVDGMSMTDIMWLGGTDMEKMKNLEGDSCPGLISDGYDRVQWVNPAYRKLVDPSKDNGEPPAEVVVWLVVKDKVPEFWQAFACTVRVVYTWRNDENDNNNSNKEQKHYSQTMPCDVWRMDFGGFAWRFDSQAALCLGR